MFLLSFQFNLARLSWFCRSFFPLKYSFVGSGSSGLWVSGSDISLNRYVFFVFLTPYFSVNPTIHPSIFVHIGCKNRQVRSHSMNENSSRSHSVMTINLFSEIADPDDSQVIDSYFNIFFSNHFVCAKKKKVYIGSKSSPLLNKENFRKIMFLRKKRDDYPWKFSIKIFRTSFHNPFSFCFSFACLCKIIYHFFFFLFNPFT